MVTPVDPAGTAARLAQLMQRTFRASATPSARAVPQPPSPARRTREPSGATADALRLRIQAISHEHPDRRRAATRFLVEALLAREFGAAAMAESACQAIVDDVITVLSETEGLRTELDRVVEHLLEA